MLCLTSSSGTFPSREYSRYTTKACTSERLMVHKSAFEIKRDDWKFDDIDLIDEAAYRQHVADKSNQRSFGREK